MRRRLTWTWTALLLMGLLFLAVGLLTAADLPTDAPDSLLIKNEGYKKRKRPSVFFTHKKHTEEYKNVNDQRIACTECHHDYDKDKINLWKEGETVKRCATTDCHDALKKVGKKHKLQIAYHRNCKDCHKKLRKAGKSEVAPYKKCAECMKTT